eukprot:SRR837773.8800.p2 GENE.SRR837773.8800~~SRR837773.8800.p2  ORF type:complete len:116 (-),score=9.32 SRR837773.8800:207-554(-)
MDQATTLPLVPARRRAGKSSSSTMPETTDRSRPPKSDQLVPWRPCTGHAVGPVGQTQALAQARRLGWERGSSKTTLPAAGPEAVAKTPSSPSSNSPSSPSQRQADCLRHPCTQPG